MRGDAIVIMCFGAWRREFCLSDRGEKSRVQDVYLVSSRNHFNVLHRLERVSFLVILQNLRYCKLKIFLRNISAVSLSEELSTVCEADEARDVEFE